MSWLKRHDLAVFLVLAFALSWAIWPFVLLDPDSEAMIPYGPFIAVFVVLALTRGDSAAFGLFWWSLAALWWVVALAVIAVIGMARDRAPSMEATESTTSGVRAQPRVQ